MRILFVTKISNSDASGLSVAVRQLLNSIYKYAEIDWLDFSGNIFAVNDAVNRKDEEKFMSSALPDIAIFESPFASLKFYKIARELRKKNVPYVLSPHGCFHKEAMKKSALKKYVVINTVFKSFFKHCKAVQYLTLGEYENSLHFNKSIVIPNGIEDKDNFRVRNRIKNIIFIGRKLKHTKGLDILLKACLEIRNFMLDKNVSIHIYGPVENQADEDYINSYIEANALSEIVFNHDAVFGAEKDTILSNADMFIHTSRHEGFPMSILEALSYGVPVLITEGTNVGDIVGNAQAGWVAKTDYRDVALKLEEAIMSTNICEYSENARKVSLNYTWDAIAEQSIRIYEKLLNDEAK